ncbi:putative glycosidase CRH2 [Linderina macrospora]|uniref:Glycosidase CRH2 n=1 Tax=Linderina macrospora TaxID=4868 RepID=A0ACC1J1F3_9FUNG|nr:putative glycosidase CRH2 [Linderina macrospora]
MQLQDDSGASISLDFVGSTTNRVQANYHVDNQVELGNPVSSVVSSDPVTNYNEYRILWQPTSISWYVNGAVIRTVNRADTWAEGLQKFTFPQKPARLSFSIWDASGSTNPGATTSWAGTIPSSKAGAQFTAYVKSVSIKCYSNSTGSNTLSVNTGHQNNIITSGSSSSDNTQKLSSTDTGSALRESTSDEGDLVDFGHGDGGSSSEKQNSSEASKQENVNQISAYLERNNQASSAVSQWRGFSLFSTASAALLATAIASI